MIAASIISSVACEEAIEDAPAPESCTAGLQYGQGTVYIDTDCEGIDSMHVLVRDSGETYAADMDFSRFFMLGTITGEYTHSPDYVCVELMDADGFELADACWFQ